MTSALKFDKWQTTAGVTINTVIQVVQTMTQGATDINLNNTEVAYSALACSITPKITGSKILMMMNLHFNLNTSTATWVEYGIRSSGYSNNKVMIQGWYDHVQNQSLRARSLTHWDNNSTITAGNQITYTPYMFCSNNVTYRMNYSNVFAGVSTLTLMEIAQ